MWIRGIAGIVGLALTAACGGNPTGPGVTGDPSDVASVRLYDGQGTELTLHTGLTEGQTLRVEVRLFTPSGQRLTAVTGGVELEFAFSPSTLASSAPVTGKPLTRDVTPTAASGTAGGLSVTLRFPEDASIKVFGPFHVQVQPSAHGDVASLRLFNAQGAELTQHMPLVSGQTTRVEVRLYDPQGNPVTNVTGGVAITFAFTPASLAVATLVDGMPMWRDVAPTASPGAAVSLNVLVRFLADDITKTYGPIDVLVH